MAIPYERLVKEDFNLGYGTVSVSMPGGGQATGSKFGIHSLLGRVYNVRDFGAAGDGVTDDQPAFQTVATLLSTEGGEVWVPAGTYKLSAAVTFSNLSGVDNSIGVLVRLHRDATIVVATTANGLVWDGSAHRFGGDTFASCGVVGGRIWVGSPTGHTSGIVVQFIKTDGAVVRDCEIRGGSTGVQFNNCYAGEVSGAWFVHNTTTISLVSISNAIRICRNDFYDCSTNCIYSDGSGNNVAFISHNYFEGLSSNTINQSADLGTADNDWHIHDNYFNDNHGSADILINSGGASIHSNSFVNQTTTAGVGISLAAASARCTVTGNIFRSVARYTACIQQNGSNNVITGNAYDSSGTAFTAGSGTNLVSTNRGHIDDVSTTWNPGAIANGAQATKQVTVTGAVKGDFAVAGFTTLSGLLALTAEVLDTDVVLVHLINNTGGGVTPASGTVTVRVWKKAI